MSTAPLSSTGSTVSVADAARDHDANALLQHVRSQIRTGRAKDAADAIRQSPELLKYKSAVIELALDEYQRRVSRNGQADIDEVVAQFPEYRSSIRRQLEVENLIANADLPLVGALTEPQWPEVGGRVAEFTIRELLGRGSFARVYVAEQLSLGRRQVVIKCCADVAQEATSLGKLSHANIVRVFNVEHWPLRGLSCISMEYAGRATLLDVLDKVASSGGQVDACAATASCLLESRKAAGLTDSIRLPWPPGRGEFLAWMGEQIACALAHAHQAQVLHLDIKPSNVLLAFDGRPTLLDFNLSSFGERAPIRLGGTLPYMAPELVAAVAQGTRVEVAPANDIFSLGVLLFELLTGRTPFIPTDDRSRRSLSDVAQCFFELHGRARETLSWPKVGVDSTLRAIIERSLAIDPRDRYATATAFAQELRAYNSHSRIVQRWAKHHRRTFLAAATALACGAVAVAKVDAMRDPPATRWLKRGLSHLRLGQYKDAIRAMNHAVDAAPANPESRYVRAFVSQRTGDYAGAISDLDDAIARVRRAKYYALRGMCFHSLGRLHQAESDFSLGRALGDHSKETLNNLGMVYCAGKSYDRAIELFDAAVELDPNWTVARFNRAVTKLTAPHPSPHTSASPLRDLQIVALVEPHSPSVYIYLAAAYCSEIPLDTTAVDNALRCLEVAVTHGADPSRITNDVRFVALGTDARFRAICSRQKVTGGSPEFKRIAEPQLDVEV